MKFTFDLSKEELEEGISIIIHKALGHVDAESYKEIGFQVNEETETDRS